MKTGIGSILIWNRVWFSRELRTVLYGRLYRFISERGRKKKKYANSKWISVKKSFLLLLF